MLLLFRELVVNSLTSIYLSCEPYEILGKFTIF